MTRLVDDLLDVSRISQGKIELQAEPIDLRAVDRPGRRDRAALRSTAARQTLTRRPARRAAVAAAATPTRLAQVVANLLHNAAKYTDRAAGIELQRRPRGDGAS